MPSCARGRAETGPARTREARAGNGSAASVELIDVPGILLAHNSIEVEEFLALRLLASWLAQFRRGFGLRQASVAGLWAALTSGARGGAVQPAGAGGDRALFRLIELHAYFRELGRRERRLMRRCALLRARRHRPTIASWPS
jgi:hypothetical protein